MRFKSTATSIILNLSICEAPELTTQTTKQEPTVRQEGVSNRRKFDSQVNLLAWELEHYLSDAHVKVLVVDSAGDGLSPVQMRLWHV